MKKNSLIFVAIATAIGFSANAQTAKLLPGEQDTIDVFKKVSPYVVNVHRIHDVIGSNWQSKTVSVGNGSGFLWDAKGHVVTNFHVIASAKGIDVTLKNGKTIQAKLLGADPRKDVAVLLLDDKSTANKLIRHESIALADTAKLSVGQTAIAIGNPFGLSQTLTEGIVSATNREVHGYSQFKITGMIQTDASINPGNSGGPLLDSSGQLLGMNTMIYTQTGDFTGIGFAIPTNTIKTIVEQIVKHGHVMQPGIGIIPAADTHASEARIAGVIIERVVPGTPAEEAGLRGIKKTLSGHYLVGDVIVAVNGVKTKTFGDLVQVLEGVTVGDELTVTVLRDHQLKKIQVGTIDINKPVNHG